MIARIFGIFCLLLFTAAPAAAQDDSCRPTGGVVGYVTRGTETIVLSCPAPDENGLARTICTCREHLGGSHDAQCRVYPCDAMAHEVEAPPPAVPAVAAGVHDPTERAVLAFLAAHTNDAREEIAHPEGYEAADLDGDGHPEIVIVWSLMGPIYSHTTLTVLSASGNDFATDAIFELAHAARLLSVKRGVITVEESDYAKGDRKCCPSLKVQRQYRFRLHTIEKWK